MSNLSISNVGAEPGGRTAGQVETPAERFAATGDVAGAAEYLRANPGEFARVEQAFFARGDLSAMHDLSTRARDGGGDWSAVGLGVALGGVQGLTATAAAAAVKRTGFATRDAAGKAALTEANPQSIKANREYGGLIYQTKDGKFGYTAPTPGTGTTFNPTTVQIPKGTKLAGDFHTHGDYSQVVNGQIVRTSNPAKDDLNSDQFSSTDRTGIAKDAKGRPGYRGYLGTPSGDFRVLDPAAKTDKILK